MIVRQSIAALLAMLLAWAAACGCGSQVVPSSGPRAPTTAADVKIYAKAPAKYEDLGRVEVPVGGDVRWDQRGEATAGFERLKAGAAAVGGNGILLEDPSGDNLKVLAGYHGTYYQVPVRQGTPNVAVAHAIYVIKP
jgi:hypothetical protein